LLKKVGSCESTWTVSGKTCHRHVTLVMTMDKAMPWDLPDENLESERRDVVGSSSRDDVYRERRESVRYERYSFHSLGLFCYLPNLALPNLALPNLALPNLALH